MNRNLCDELARRFTTGLSRRSLTGVVGLGMTSWLAAPQDLDAKKKKKKKKKKPPAPPPCTPDPAAQTCTDRCGNVTNNCQQVVNCGHCDCAGISSSADLQSAINATAAGTTLTLCAGTWSLPTMLTITRDITVRGAGVGQTIIDGRDAVRALWVESGATVSLQDVTITRGVAYGFSLGGGIFNEGTLHLRSAEVTACQSQYGGGIFNNNRLHLHDGTRVSRNVAYEGGGIYHDGVQLILNDGSRIYDNDAIGGGGIFVQSGEITLGAGSRVSGNRAVDGAGLSIQGKATLQDGAVVGGTAPEDANVAEEQGGGIHEDGEVILESGSRVIGNRADQGGGIFSWQVLTVRSGGRITGNTARVGGGIGRQTSSDVTIETGAVICSNLPLTDQCTAIPATQCPSSETGICPE